MIFFFSFSYYKANSFNTQMYDECVEFYTPGGDRRPYSKWNNEAQCTANGGQWIKFSNYLEKAPGKKFAYLQFFYLCKSFREFIFDK